MFCSEKPALIFSENLLLEVLFSSGLRRKTVQSDRLFVATVANYLDSIDNLIS